LPIVGNKTPKFSNR